MTCYDCGAEVVAGVEKCPACNCPSDSGEALVCLRSRLMSEEIDAESALDQLGRAKIAMLCAGGLRLLQAIILLVQAGVGDASILALGIAMVVLAGGYVALALLIRKAPLALSIVGLGMSTLFLNGFPGVVILGAMLLSLWFAVQHVRTMNRVDLLKRKIDKLNKCTEHSI